MLKTNSKRLLALTILYIYIPVCVFLFGFTKIYIAMLTVIAIAYSGFKMFNSFAKDNNEDGLTIIRWPVLFLTSVIIITLCIIMGYGNLFPQPGDWIKHNAVLHDLVNKKWPVYYTKYDKCMLTYYIGQYMVPALVGKIFGSIRISEIAMAIWGIVGVFLAYYNLVRITKSNTEGKQIRTLFIMFFFCGALVLSQIVLKGIYGQDMYSEFQNHWILAKGHMLQYRSNYVMLSWVYPQALVPWLVVMLFYEYRERIDNYVIMIAPVLLFGTFNMVAFALLSISYVIYRLLKSQERKDFVKKIFSHSNLSVFCTFGVVILSYFIGFLRSEKHEVLSLRFVKYSISDIWVVVFFLFFMVGVYVICIIKDSKDFVFYISILGLVITPFFTMGLHNDWVMCVSIPFLFVLMIKVIVFLNKDEKNASQGFRCGILAVCLMIGAWYPFVELKENVSTMANGYEYVENNDSLEENTNLDDEYIAVDVKYNYYNYNLENDFFYKYLAKRKIKD